MATTKWLEYVTALAHSNIEFPHLKTALLAQSILECGRGSTKLFQEHNNPRGVHYHDFLKKWAVGVDYVTDTEPDGHGLFCHFFSMKDAVESYFAWFDHWEHYGDWRTAAKKTATDFLSHIGPHYCPPGYTPAWIKAHGGLNYHQYIMQNLYDEAEKLLMKVGPATPTEFKVTWFEFNRAEDGKSVVVGYDGDKPKFVMRNNNVEAMIKTMQKFPDAKTFLVAPRGKTIPGVEDEPKPEPKPTTSKRVLLDPGHSERHVGARGLNSNVQEEDLNRLQATVLKAELEKLGIAATIIDPIDDDLYSIGASAKGYDAFVSLHLNAYKNKDFYTCTMCHPTKQATTSKSAIVASAAAQAMASALGNACFGGTQNWPKGVMATGLSVLSGAVASGVPIAFLSEAFFVDAYDNNAVCEDKIRKAMPALAKVLFNNL
jgi:N-acetylmuramoyl-L-alanine amidase